MAPLLEAGKICASHFRHVQDGVVKAVDMRLRGKGETLGIVGSVPLRRCP